MSWDVQIADPVWRDLDKLPRKIAQAVVEFVTVTLPTNPARMSKELVGEFAGLRSARRGEYRVLFRLEPQTHMLRVLRVRHREFAYKPPAPR